MHHFYDHHKVEKDLFSIKCLKSRPNLDSLK
jgi:hypothetical protein